MPMTLGYWDIRGLAHTVRLLLEYTGTSYEEKRYSMGDAPDFDRSQWLSEKFKLGLDIPNLPYLIDGTHKLTQSNAIVRYLGRKHNLCGETEEEKIRVDILVNQAMDSRMQLITICFNPDFVSAQPWAGNPSPKVVSVGADSCLFLQEKLKPDYLKDLPEKLTLYSQFLGKRPWFAGDKITIADFHAYDVLDGNRIFAPGCLDAFPNLKDFMARFEALPKIAAYMKSSRFLPRPIFPKVATWTGK
ncbi:glutathione S-transferase Mu 2-like isoform X1 [Ochotona curzoniae]|uniref:glutathione S-transferase Mu 2-like isoform X1 n=1 Tax=Ochotona curzoniae TaxID=130825 RepID=UPI001B347108|nr:glutathione S-transferase Mu 2-like isoform X1 [Ochotona curzoniae]